MQEKKSVNVPKKWYNQDIDYTFGKEMLTMEKKKALSIAKPSKPKMILPKKIEMPSLMSPANELDSTCGVNDDDMTKRFIEAVRMEEKVKEIKKLPVSGYDKEKRRAYIQYPGGRRDYV